MTSPVSMIIWSIATLTAGYRRCSSSAYIQCVVAGRPSSRPESATRNAPVQELAIFAPAACHFTSQGTQPRFTSKDVARSSSRPGTTTRSGVATSAAVMDGCRLTPSRQVTLPLLSPTSRTSNMRAAGFPVRSACERSALFRASIRPAVPSDAVPDSAAITTETIDSDCRSASPRRSAMAVPARKLSDRTLPMQLLSAVRSWMVPAAEGQGLSQRRGGHHAGRAAGTRRQRMGIHSPLPAVEDSRAQMGPEDPSHDRRCDRVLSRTRRGNPRLAGRAHCAALQRRRCGEVRLPRHTPHAGDSREGRRARARRSRHLSDRLVRDPGADVLLAGRLRVALKREPPLAHPPSYEPRCPMNPDDFPMPKQGFVITHVLVVADQDRSREFYRSLFGGQVLLERDPVIIKVANTWLTLNTGGGPTDDKPDVTLSPPTDPRRASGFLNVRVADIAAIYEEWSAKGIDFLTEPKDHGRENRAYVRDPDDHLIEVGQTTGLLD